MPHSSDSSDSSFSRSPPPGKQDSSDDVRKVQRREKNRIAAQKSRQRQTQKADTLHLVSAPHPPGSSWLRDTLPVLTRLPQRPLSLTPTHAAADGLNGEEPR
ncbi:basic leucine zipper transcriptional factor ATF-like, partial [Erinaceus europaeus]|uniref:Basic leucine zipper transcriptional factor ATF-like n=1 Tax=Erinaceus europaeus TaxID=9365 RepID=A0ABM3WTU6_ERIEU